MSLVFAGITPHPPLLVPAIGQGELDKLMDTREALARLEEDLYLAKPERILIIAPHGSYYHDAFTINAHPHFSSAFEEFGDLTTKVAWHGASEWAARIRHAASRENIPLQTVSQPALDHSASVPLFYLTPHLPNIQILPIGYSDLSSTDHLNFGAFLKEMIAEDHRRIAVIASADLAHNTEKHSDRSFDSDIIDLLQVRNTTGLASLSPERVAAAQACGYRSLLILLGILKNCAFEFKTYSYEAPFGIGYLVGRCVF